VAPPFKKILIANRGEIACRVMKTAKRLGIKTVAVFSEADASALHVEMADEAVLIGPPPAAQSYLLADKIIEVCKQTGAEAVHPGYGFLSERASFAEALAKAKIAFIGPPPKAIAAMGDKIESKRLAQKAGVSVVPGFVGEIADVDHAAKIAKEIGYPVMMKASAGGGGKGMRLAWDEKELRETFDSVRGEAKSSFNDDRVFIEKFVENPRHIEIQVLGDSHGNLLYLGERECSIQRRHQKVVEEAPSPFVTPEMRKAMGEQAVLLGKAVGYFSAGTVEFIAGADRSFYFLEMNTRLQVEHPVTEYITGLDLVEQMIRVAAGEKLPFTQKDVKLKGWAIETRVYAEDPYRGFLPAIGRLTRYREPVQENGIRVDTGIAEGSEISIYYDPMIAKLVSYGETREAAIDKQIGALDRYLIRGVGHNIDFLSAVLQHPRFRSGNISTGFIAEEFPQGFHGAPLTDQKRSRLIVAAAVLNAMEVERAGQIDGKLNGRGAVFGDDWVVVLDKTSHNVAVTRQGETFAVKAEDGNHQVRVDWTLGDPSARLEIDGAVVAIEVDRTTLGWRIGFLGSAHILAVHTPRRYELSQFMIEKPAPDLSRFLLCPMPGLVLSLNVAEGASVEAGQPLAVVEAMKMQNILRAEKKAKVKAVPVKAGDTLAAGAIIMEFE
jgi:propionyl-CoA carboxylase alpha chain